MNASATPGGLAPRVYSYTRFSTPEQVRGDSKRRQVDAARAWAEERGLTLDEELVDEGVSAFRGANRRDDAALGAFLNAVQTKDVPPGSVLIVESLDRISRDRILEAQTVVNSLLIAGISVVTLGDGREYSRESVNANPTELLLSLLVLMRANEESETKARRLKAVWENKRRQVAAGKPVRLTATAPAWLTPDDAGSFTVIEERAAVVRRIFADTIAGKGQGRIAADLTAEGVPSWRGAVGWHRTYVRKILDNPAVIGTLTPHTTERQPGGGTLRRPVGEPVEGYYPAVIDAATWATARAMLGAKGGGGGAAGRGRHAGKAVRHLLAGIAVCPISGDAMTRVTKGPRGGRPYLVCSRAKRGAGCVYHAVPVEAVEAAIHRNAEEFMERFPSAGGAMDAARDALAQTEREDAAAVEELEELAALRRAKRLLPVHRAREAELYEERQRLEDRKASLRGTLAAGGSGLVEARVNGLAAALADEPASEDLSGPNAAFRAAFTAVVIDHRTEELVFRWRHGGETVLGYAHPFGVPLRRARSGTLAQ